MEVFIPAAGLGTRLKPLTDSIPKALVEINGVTLLEMQLMKLAREGFNHFVINIHHFAGQITGFLNKNNNFGLKIDISDESRLLLDTGGGLKKALNLLNEDNFLIHNVDIISGLDIKKFMEFHAGNGSIATLAVQKRESSRYFLFDEKGLLCGWENVKTGEKKVTRKASGELERFAFSGIHAVDRNIRSLMPPGEVFSIVDFYLSIAQEVQITYFEQKDAGFIDLGKIANLDEAARLLKYNK